MTKIEKAAWQGFRDFKTAMCSIWQLYLKYGDVVLEKDLEEGDEEFKKLFTESNKDSLRFCEKILNYWRDNYHYVAKNYSDLVNIFKMSEERDNSNFVTLLPEATGYTEGETKGQNQTYAVSEELYEQISKDIKASVGKELLLIRPDEKLYLVVYLEDNPKRTYNRVFISKERTIIFA